MRSDPQRLLEHRHIFACGHLQYLQFFQLFSSTINIFMFSIKSRISLYAIFSIQMSVTCIYLIIEYFIVGYKSVRLQRLWSEMWLEGFIITYFCSRCLLSLARAISRHTHLSLTPFSNTTVTSFMKSDCSAPFVSTDQSPRIQGLSLLLPAQPDYTQKRGKSRSHLFYPIKPTSASLISSCWWNCFVLSIWT